MKQAPTQWLVWVHFSDKDDIYLLLGSLAKVKKAFYLSFIVAFIQCASCDSDLFVLLVISLLQHLPVGLSCVLAFSSGQRNKETTNYCFDNFSKKTVTTLG